MKLQKRANRKVGTKEYVKWYVNIPADLIKEMGWKEGQEIIPIIKNQNLVLDSKLRNKKKLDMS